MTLGQSMFVGLLILAAAVVLLQWWVGHRGRRAEGQPVPKLSGALGERLAEDVVLWFHSPTCAPCRVMQPEVDALVARGEAVAIDVTEDFETAKAFGVMATPTTVWVRGGVVRRVVTGRTTLRELNPG